jgi:hypothetical protein
MLILRFFFFKYLVCLIFFLNFLAKIIFHLASRKEFVRTVEKPQPSPDGDYGVYALDCEMCYSTGSGEPAQIAVISSDGKTVYETLAFSEKPITDRT